ncbi:hypothetical protein, partial [Methylobrevis pamukkalensis]|uniref:hypothetical protein n=1 Tax=Methylobrevis pamukkalensis TaxID=1439726 RepID=UPI001FD9BC95
MNADLARMGFGDRDVMVRAAIAKHHDVGDTVGVIEVRDVGAPLIEPAAVGHGSRQAPEDLIAEGDVDAQGSMAAHDDLTRDLFEERRSR